MKPLQATIMLILMLAIVVGANIYMGRRYSLFFDIDRRTLLTLGFSALTILMMFGMIGLSNSLTFLGSVGYRVSAIITGFILYLLLSTLLFDLLNLGLRFPPRTIGLLTVGLTVLLCSYGIWNSWNTKLVKIDIPIESLDKEVKIMHLTDVHLGHFRGNAFLENIMSMTKQEHVDAIFITGDLFDGKIRIEDKYIKPLTSLGLPVFFVNGNHDEYSGVKRIKELLRSEGINVLENELVHWNGIQILGLNHMLADSGSVDMHGTGQKANIQSTLPLMEIDSKLPSILLHHSPDGVQYAASHGIDLYLAGHTHAGQLFPIIYINDLIFKYNRGLQSLNDTRVYVSHGAGTFGPPMRIGTRSEITLVTLIPKS